MRLCDLGPKEKNLVTIWNTNDLEEQKNHVVDCYFCLVNVKGYSRKNKHLIQYTNLDSGLRPIPHIDQIPVPTFTHLLQIDDQNSASSLDLSQDQLEDSEFQMSDSSLDKRLPSAAVE